MASTAELLIPVRVDGQTVLTSFAQMEQAARQVAAAASEIGGSASERFAASIEKQRELAAAYRATAGVSQKASEDSAEFDRRTTALAIRGIEDQKERRLAAVRVTLQAEEAALDAIITKRRQLGEISEREAEQQRQYVRQLSAEAIAAQEKVAGVSTATPEGGRSDTSVNARGVLSNVFQGAQQAAGAKTVGDAFKVASNDIAQFATGLVEAAATARSTGTSFTGELAAAFTGAGGVILAIQAAIVIIPILINYLNQEADAQRAAADAAREHAAGIQDVIDAARRKSAADAYSGRQSLEQPEQDAQASIELIGRLRAQLAAAPRASTYGNRADIRGLNDVLVEQLKTRELITAEQAEQLRGDDISRSTLQQIDLALQRTTGSRVAGLRAVRAEQERLDADNANNPLYQQRRLGDERTRLLSLGQDASEVGRQLNDLDNQLQRLGASGQYDPDTLARRAAAAARTAAREAATAARKQARDAAQAAREAARIAKQQADLLADLQVAATREGLQRELAAAKKLYDERLVVARSNASLRAAVEAAYLRDVAQLTDADERKRTDRQLAALDQVAGARREIDAALGAGQDALAESEIQTIRTNALTQAAIAVDRAKTLDQQQNDLGEITRIIQRGTLADAERLALVAGEGEQLDRVRALLLRRLALEAEIVGRVRERRIEAEREGRAAADTDRALSDRAGESLRLRQATLSGRPGASRTDAEQAFVELQRAQQALADVDAALAEARRATANATSGESPETVTAKQREREEQLRVLMAERTKAAGAADEAEVKSSEAATAEIVKNYERRRDAARKFAEAAVQAIADAFDYERKYTDLDVEATRERYRREEEDLRQSLARREGDTQETSLRLREIAAERATFEKDLEKDRAGFIARSAHGLTDVILAEIRRQVAAAIAAAAVSAFLRVVSGGFAPPVSPVFASGGAVVGPGTAKSDSIVARLSNGEHVLTAAEVAQMGGHGAVYRMRELAMTGRLPQFARGGPVGYDEMPTPRVYADRPAAGAAGGFDVSGLSAEVAALRQDVQSQTATLRQAQHQAANQIAGSVGDPDRARRLVSLGRAREATISPRGTRRSL